MLLLSLLVSPHDCNTNNISLIDINWNIMAPHLVLSLFLICLLDFCYICANIQVKQRTPDLFIFSETNIEWHREQDFQSCKIQNG